MEFYKLKVRSKKYKVKNEKGYSLVELLVSMAIFGLIMIMLTRVLLSGIEISYNNYNRSLQREAVSEVMDYIKRDIRNANVISSCSSGSCTISHAENVTWSWAGAGKPIIRYKDNAGTLELTKTTPEYLYINKLNFEMVQVSGTTTQYGYTDNTIIVTIESAMVRSENDLIKISQGKIPFDIQQIIISTRNAK